jgi:hypothetical protein
LSLESESGVSEAETYGRYPFSRAANPGKRPSVQAKPLKNP